MIGTGILIAVCGLVVGVIAMVMIVKGMLKGGAAVTGAMFEAMGDSVHGPATMRVRESRPDVIMSRTSVSVSSSKTTMTGFLAQHLGLGVLLTAAGLTALSGFIITVYGIIKHFSH